MAKSKSNPGGPGTAVNGGVSSPMSSPFSKGSNKGSGNGMSGPFNAPRAGGDNNLPTTVYDKTIKASAPKSTPTTERDSLGTIEV